MNSIGKYFFGNTENQKAYTLGKPTSNPLQITDTKVSSAFEEARLKEENLIAKMVADHKTRTGKDLTPGEIKVFVTRNARLHIEETEKQEKRHQAMIKLQKEVQQREAQKKAMLTPLSTTPFTTNISRNPSNSDFAISSVVFNPR